MKTKSLIKALSKAGLLTISMTLSGMSLAGEVKWSYAGELGPENWSTLSPDFATCGSGNEQSPINIDIGITNVVKLKDIEIEQKSWALEVVNNGHTVQVNMAPGSTMEIGEKEYHLLQFHFHTRSENTINQQDFPMEVHFVHMNSHGQLGVLAVMFEAGESNETLEAILATHPVHEGKHALHHGGDINPSALIPVDHDEVEEYFNFTGSLTTPPCSEGVNWLVAKQTVEASAEQLHEFTKILTHEGAYSGNNRPVQPLNLRVVKESKD